MAERSGMVVPTAEWGRAPEAACRKRLASVAEPVRSVTAGLVRDLSALVNTLFTEADDHFYSLSERSANTDRHEAVFDTMRSLRNNRQSVTGRFLQLLADGFAKAWESGTVGTSQDDVTTARPSFSLDDLSVLSADETELHVAVGTIGERSQERNRGRLGILLETLNSLDAAHVIAIEGHPLAPPAIVQAFAIAQRPIGLDIESTIVVLKLFERHVADRLGDAYEVALSLLREAGVEIVRPANHKPDRRERAGARPADHSESGDLGARSDAAAVGGSVGGVAPFAQLRALLGRGGVGQAGVGYAGQTGGPAMAASPANTERLLDELVRIERQIHDQLVGRSRLLESYPTLQSVMLAAPAEAGGFREAPPDHQHVLRLVSDLFQHMFRNQNLSVASKALIARLQLPVLKVALRDQSVFDNRDHPVRGVINRLASEGVGWPSNQALLERSNSYRVAESIVSQLGDLQKPEASDFKRFLEEWSAMAESYQRRTKVALGRLGESVLGKVRLDAAKRVVQDTLNEQVQGLPLPAVVTELISGELTQAMVVECARNGTQSQKWADLLDALSALLALTAGGADRETARPALTAEELPIRLRELMQHYGLFDSQVSARLQSIQALLVGIQGASADDLTYAVDELEVMEEIILAEPPDLIDDPRNDTELLDGLGVGSWVEFAKGDDLLRCQLAAIIEQAQLYVFASESGQKVREYSRRALVRGLEDGSIRRVGTDLLVEYALNDLLAELKDYVP